MGAVNATIFYTSVYIGPHGEWMEMNQSTIAIDQEGNYDITFQTKMFEKEFTKFILEETKESISKF